MQPFLALITPVGDGGGTQPPSGGPPYPSTGPGFPTNPIAKPPWGWGSDNPPPGWYPHPSHPIWYPGLGIWGGRPPNYVDIGGPGPQPPPLGIWGGSGVGDYIDAGFPGPQPGKPPQIWGGPYFPPVIWPGPGPLPYPDQGLPGAQPEGDRKPLVEWKTAWSPSTGWIVVGVPTGEHVTPSTAPAAKPATPTTPTTPPKP